MSRPASPRIVALRRSVEDGDHEALDAFWWEVTQRGAPLIEPMEGNKTSSLATFLWRDDRAGSVALMSSVNPTGPQDGVMARLLDTDLWYRTEWVRHDAIISYHFAPGDSLVEWTEDTTFEEIVALYNRLQPDPLNPKTFVMPRPEVGGFTHDIVWSLLMMPDAPQQPFSDHRLGVPAGKVEHSRFRSELLDNERSVWIYTPPAYDPFGHPYGLLVVFDGDAYLRSIRTNVILDNLLADGKIPPMVCLLVDNASAEARATELACNEPFADFLVRELLPWVAERYRITDDPSRTVAAGSSMGGLASMYLGYQHPERFGKLLCQSSVFYWSPGITEDPQGGTGWLPQCLAENPRLPLDIYMDAGFYEDRLLRQASTILGSNRHMRDVLVARGYPHRYVEFSGGHDYVWWRGTLADGLIYLIGGQG